jgi:hypothetical protein
MSGRYIPDEVGQLAASLPVHQEEAVLHQTLPNIHPVLSVQRHKALTRHPTHTGASLGSSSTPRQQDYQTIPGEDTAPCVLRIFKKSDVSCTYVPYKAIESSRYVKALKIVDLYIRTHNQKESSKEC